MDTLLTFSDVLCIQEHFLLDCSDRKSSNTDKIRKKFNINHDMYIKPAEKDNTQVSRGRGKGGLATIWKKSLTKYVSKIDCINPRLQATKFSFPSSTLVVLNAYFPCDPRNSRYDDAEILNVLSEINNIVTNGGIHNFLLAGDLNCHFERDNLYTNLVKDYFRSLSLQTLWSISDPRIDNIDYTYCSFYNDIPSYSILDHFVVNELFFDKLVNAGVIHSGENLSNHEAIYVKFKVDKIDPALEIPPTVSWPCWSKASLESKNEYKKVLGDKLSLILMYEFCKDVNCNFINHYDAIEEYTMEVHEAIEQAGEECIPKSVFTNKKIGDQSSLSGWSQYVKLYENDSKFWFSLWNSAGRPYIWGSLCQYEA